MDAFVLHRVINFLTSYGKPVPQKCNYIFYSMLKSYVIQIE